MTRDVPLILPPGQQAALEAAYATPPRAYHDFSHVREVLRHYDAVAAGPGWVQPAEVQLAVLYHDAIYEAGRSDNEARSADLAVEHIARWLPDAGVDASRVAELIRLTARHGKFTPDDFAGDAAAADTMHFLDCDMAILGAEPAVFDAYDRGIAAEYRGHVPAGCSSSIAAASSRRCWRASASSSATSSTSAWMRRRASTCAVR